MRLALLLLAALALVPRVAALPRGARARLRATKHALRAINPEHPAHASVAALSSRLARKVRRKSHSRCISVAPALVSSVPPPPHYNNSNNSTHYALSSPAGLYRGQLAVLGSPRQRCADAAAHPIQRVYAARRRALGADSGAHGVDAAL